MNVDVGRNVGNFNPGDDPESVSGQETFAEAVDPKLLERSLKRIRSYLRGNALDLKSVHISESVHVLTYRFRAGVQIKMVPQYGVKTEPGKNMRAELAVSQEDFQRKIRSSVHDIATVPQKRQLVVDFVFNRSDKGFCIKDQAVKFKSLARDIVQHEQCAACTHSGYVPCSRCRGKRMEVCPNCRGTRQMPCSKCGGSGRLQTAQGSMPCDFCHGQTRISCTMCGAQGQVKCRGCGARGEIACQKCSGTGWLSHVAHIEFQGRVHFSFEKHKLPPRLVSLIEDRGAFLASRGDLEVSLLPQQSVQTYTTGEDVSQQGSENAFEDTVLIEYDASCPYGALEFDADTKKIPTILLGWQARLIEAPSFLEDYTRAGIEALEEAGQGKGQVRIISLLKRAARYAIWKELLSQVLQSGNLRKVTQIMLNRYEAGVSRDCMVRMVKSSDRAIRSVTRLPRYAGIVSGLVLYAAIVFKIYESGLRGDLANFFGVSAVSSLSHIFDIFFTLCGILLGGGLGQLTAWIAQKRAFSGIVSDDILSRRLPRMGVALIWAVTGSLLITIGGLIAAALTISEGDVLDIPEWIIRLMPA
ncbi:MAG: hypothetical protein RBR86_07475 [Pseudobdellovibrionaceae bacterium]|jgi:hypothetical protein|nr:hypothetical protein [Pseudobdellovibrionaceae bacterium]